jgi:hypothetical protein
MQARSQHRQHGEGLREPQRILAYGHFGLPGKGFEQSYSKVRREEIMPMRNSRGVPAGRPNRLTDLRGKFTM